MKVAIDSRVLSDPKPSGVGYYLLNLVRHLLMLPHGDQYQLFSDRHLDLPELSGAAQVVFRGPLGKGWQQLALPVQAWKQRIDVYHSPAYTLPRLSTARLVVTIHDLTFLISPQLCDDAVVAFLRARVPAAVRGAHRIVAVSEATKRDLVGYLNVDPDRISVTSLAVDPRFGSRASARELADFRRRHHLDRYLLYVGNVEPRKNLERLITAFARLRKAGLPHRLVIAGQRGWKSEGIYRAAAPLVEEGALEWLGYLPRDEMPLLYQGADLFVFPSLYEGFGLPILEAMASGVPVLTSNNSGMAEVAGDAAALLDDPTDVDELARRMEQLLTDAPARQELAARGLVRAGQFSWRATAERTALAYREAMEA